MRAGYCWAVLLVAHLAAHAATAPVQLLWDKHYGGSSVLGTNGASDTGKDLLRVVHPLPDGGLLLGGDSDSLPVGGKTSKAYGGWDIWLVRVDVNGNKLWEQSYGGTNDDRLRKILPLPDGGFLLAGESSSCASGTKTSCASGPGTDWWLVRIDAEGKQLWDKSYWITDYDDRLTAALALPDGGFLLGGWDTGLLGNEWPPFPRTPRDYWLVRVNGGGKELWRQRYWGQGGTELKDIVATGEGGFLLCGDSMSGIGGIKTTPHCGVGGYDVWLVRVDAQGQKLWEQNLGRPSDGSYEDLYLKAVPLAAGGFVVGVTAAPPESRAQAQAARQLATVQGEAAGGGCSSSPGWGGADYWLVRLDARGNVLWDRLYGGDASDWLYDLRATRDGGFWLGGGSASAATGSKTCAAAGPWLVRVNGQGEMVWDCCLDLGTFLRLDPGPNQGLFVAGVTVEAPLPDRWLYRIAPWVRAVGPGGISLWEFVLPLQESDPNALYLFGRTTDGGFYAGGLDVTPFSDGDYRVVKIGPAPVPATQDHARLLALTELQGEIKQDGFLLSVVGVQNTTYVTEYSTNLVDWTPLATNHVGQVDVKVRDLGATNAPERYYRARVVR